MPNTNLCFHTRYHSLNTTLPRPYPFFEEPDDGIGPFLFLVRLHLQVELVEEVVDSDSWTVAPHGGVVGKLLHVVELGGGRVGQVFLVHQLEQSVLPWTHTPNTVSQFSDTLSESVLSHCTDTQ